MIGWFCCQSLHVVVFFAVLLQLRSLLFPLQSLFLPLLFLETYTDPSWTLSSYTSTTLIDGSWIIISQAYRLKKWMNLFHSVLQIFRIFGNKPCVCQQKLLPFGSLRQTMTAVLAVKWLPSRRVIKFQLSTQFHALISTPSSNFKCHRYPKYIAILQRRYIFQSISSLVSFVDGPLDGHVLKLFDCHFLLLTFSGQSTWLCEAPKGVWKTQWWLQWGAPHLRALCIVTRWLLGNGFHDHLGAKTRFIEMSTPTTCWCWWPSKFSKASWKTRMKAHVNHAINQRPQLVQLEQRWVLHVAAMCFSTNYCCWKKSFNQLDIYHINWCCCRMSFSPRCQAHFHQGTQCNLAAVAPILAT